MHEWNTLLGRFKYVLNWVNSFRPNLLGFRVWLAQCSQSLGEGYPISCPRWLAGPEQEEREKVEEGGAGARRWEVRQRALILPFPCVQAVEAWSLLCPPGKEVPRRESELFLDLVSHKQRSWVSLNTSHMAVPHNKKLNCISVHSPRKDGFKPVQWDTVSRREVKDLFWQVCGTIHVRGGECREEGTQRAKNLAAFLLPRSLFFFPPGAPKGRILPYSDAFSPPLPVLTRKQIPKNQCINSLLIVKFLSCPLCGICFPHSVGRSGWCRYHKPIWSKEGVVEMAFVF